MFVDIENEEGEAVVVGVVYKSNVVNFKDFCDDWNNLLEIARDRREKVIVAGDFNINVRDLSCVNSRDFLGMTNEHGFRQVVTEITRPSQFGGSIIDHFYTNCLTDTSSVVIKSLLSDHYPVVCGFHYIFRNCRWNEAGKFVTEQVDWIGVESEMKVMDFGDILGCDSVDYGMNLLVDRIKNLVFRYTTSQVKYKRYLCPKKPWITLGILRSIRKREKMKYKLNKNPALNKLKVKYVRYRNILSSTIDLSRKKYFEARINGSVNKAKVTWDLVKGCYGKGREKQTIPKTVINAMGISVGNPTEVVNVFNDYFLNVNGSVKLGSNDGYRQYLRREPNSIFWRPTTDSEILNIINCLENKRTMGPDGISNFVLKRVKVFIVPCLVHLSNLMLQTGVFPKILKEARIVLVFKKGKRDEVKNYRPISILNSFSKIFEKVIYGRIYNFLFSHNIFAVEQFAYINKRSAEDAVFNVTDCLNDCLDRGEFVAAVSLDIRKAFDSINHSILFEKLNYVGIRGASLDLLKSYLTNRTQYVCMENLRSNIGTIRCGVPQGSILGPLLFNVYVNDIVRIKGNGRMTMYADDNIVFYSHKDIINMMNGIQTVINDVCEWYKCNTLFLNSDKCKFIVFYSSFYKRYISSIHHTLVLLIGEDVFLPEERINYLGVIIDNNLKWLDHIFKVSNKLSFMVSVFYKLRRFFNRSVLLMIFNALCQSVLRYAVLSYASTHKSKLDRLVSLQRKIVRIMFFVDRFGNVNGILREYKVMNVFQMNIEALLLTLRRKDDVGKSLKLTLISVVPHVYNTRSTPDEFVVRMYNNSYGRFCINIRLPTVVNFFKRYSDMVDFNLNVMTRSKSNRVIRKSLFDFGDLLRDLF